MPEKIKEYDTWIPEILIKYAKKSRRKFYTLEQEYDRSQTGKPFILFLAAILFYFILLSMFYLFVILFIFSAGFTVFSVRDFMLSVGFFFVVVPFSFLVLYNYPRLRAFLLKLKLEPELKDVARIFLAELDMGHTSSEILKVLANSDLEAASKEFKYILDLVDNQKTGLLEALMLCAQRTPSDRFREFLYELNLTIRNEKELRRLLARYANKES